MLAKKQELKQQCSDQIYGILVMLILLMLTRTIKLKIMEILLSNYYAPIVEVNDLNVLIYGKSFFDSPVKYKEKTYEKMSTNNEYIAGNLLDYEYSLKHYKLIPIDLNK